ncbi:MAG TPA: tetratricopeptide repeat protein [Patescibacteria group bacterium]|nr:tetratricopeptide repeat protein [Patescibacteria group bacterium]
MSFEEGLRLQQAGDREGAEAHYRQELTVNPQHENAWMNLGVILKGRGDFAAATECYQRALALTPQKRGVCYNLGNLELAQGNLTAAADYFRRELALDPNDGNVLTNLARVLEEAAKWEEAQAIYQRVAQLRPEDADAWNNLGKILLSMNRPAAAMAHFERALVLDPGFVVARSNRAIALKAQGRLEEAVREYEAAVAQDSGRPEIRSNLLFTLQYQEKWNAERIFLEHREWARRHADVVTLMPPAAERRTGRLRIGYVSPDFRKHSVSFFIEPVLERHDRNRFEIFAYADVMRQDEVTERIREKVDVWRNVTGLDDERVAAMIRDDGIDVLIDLAGHTAGNRLLVFARRPASVQMTWIGYPNTTGMTTMDYRITDAQADPPGMTEQWHSEKLLRLPDSFLCYRPPDEAPPVGALPAASGQRVTFGSFNNFAKISPRTYDLWARVLQAVPGSRLLVKIAGSTDEHSMSERVRQELAQRGIGPQRLETVGEVVGAAAHLSRYHQIDIALDTYPYHGTTTTCDALWMGVPVVTLAGGTHVSRVGASLLTVAGLADWIAANEGEYIAIAAAKAADLKALAELRSGLRKQLASSPLTDACRFTAALETALKQVSGRQNGNAAFYYVPDGYETGGGVNILGRQAAGEGFLQSFIRTAGVESFYCYTPAAEYFTHFTNRVQAVLGPETVCRHLPASRPVDLAEVGCLYLPDPGVAAAAWRRRWHGCRSYSLCGVTHTTASDRVMDAIGSLLTAPVQPWDALVCTSRAVRQTVDGLLERYGDYLSRRWGGGGRPAAGLELPVIPLGVDCTQFPQGEERQRVRAQYRQNIGAGPDDIVVLFVGRLSFHSKAHPLPMLLGLEEVARREGRNIILVQAGWFFNESIARTMQEAIRTFAPSIREVFLDGRRDEIRKNIWAAADLFVSLSDNIQETFGLTPIEAMAAGLPVLVSDWDGYCDTVRHGREGFRIPTLIPAPDEAGRELAQRYGSGLTNYDQYIAAASLMTAVDPAAFADACATLIRQPDLRRQMGEAGRQRALRYYDWPVIVRRYQELWQHLAEIRQQAPMMAPCEAHETPQPLRDDPFRVFAGYATAVVETDSRVALAFGADSARLDWLRSSAINTSITPDLLLTRDEQVMLLERLQRCHWITVGELSAVLSPSRGHLLAATLTWLAKMGLIRLHGRLVKRLPDID